MTRPRGARRTDKGGVYLLHFVAPISPAHTTQHYLGWASDLESRLADHLAGRGARLTQVAISRGITWVVARTWPGEDRKAERRHKRTHGPKLCPICRAERGGR